VDIYCATIITVTYVYDQALFFVQIELCNNSSMVPTPVFSLSMKGGGYRPHRYILNSQKLTQNSINGLTPAEWETPVHQLPPHAMLPTKLFILNFLARMKDWDTVTQDHNAVRDAHYHED
jgi:hypothetical protein